MKLLTASGVTLIKGAPSRRTSGPRDPFPSHATGGYSDYFINGAASGNNFYVRAFILKDGTTYFYPVNPPGADFSEPPPAEAQELFTAGHGGGWVGEWWNQFGRPAVFDKVTADDMDAWLASH